MSHLLMLHYEAAAGLAEPLRSSAIPVNALADAVSDGRSIPDDALCFLSQHGAPDFAGLQAALRSLAIGWKRSGSNRLPIFAIAQGTAISLMTITSHLVKVSHATMNAQDT